MDNEKFQDLMLEHFGKVLNKLSGMESELTEVKSELTEVKSELTEVKSELTEVKSELSTVKTELSEVKQSQTRMENDFGKKLDILYYDWRETQKEFNEEVKTELQILSTKVDDLQMESSKHDQEIKDLYLVKASKE